MQVWRLPLDLYRDAYEHRPLVARLCGNCQVSGMTHTTWLRLGMQIGGLVSSDTVKLSALTELQIAKILDHREKSDCPVCKERPPESISLNAGRIRECLANIESDEIEELEKLIMPTTLFNNSGDLLTKVILTCPKIWQAFTGAYECDVQECDLYNDLVLHHLIKEFYWRTRLTPESILELFAKDPLDGIQSTPTCCLL